MARTECEATTKGKAYRIHPEKTTNMLEGYTQEEGLIICELELGKCPYKSQREAALFADSDTGIVYYCNSNGRIPKTLEEIPLTL